MFWASDKRLLLLVGGTALVAVLGVLVFFWVRDTKAVADLKSPDADSATRLQAMKTLAGKTGEEKAKALTVQISNTDLKVARTAVRELGLMHRQEDLPVLKQAAISDPRPEVKEAAVRALDNYAEAAAPVMIEVFDKKETHPEAKALAADSLGKNRVWEAMPKLVDALEDPSPVVRGRAYAAVRKILGLDYGFRAEADESVRKPIVARIRSDWRLQYPLHLDYMRRLKAEGKQP